MAMFRGAEGDCCASLAASGGVALARMEVGVAVD
jgi:hypothetical protein